MKDRYCIIDDGDGHNYLCPLERAEEAQLIFDAIGDYWDNERYNEKGVKCPKEPDFLKRIGYPSEINFTDPREGNDSIV